MAGNATSWRRRRAAEQPQRQRVDALLPRGVLRAPTAVARRRRRPAALRATRRWRRRANLLRRAPSTARSRAGRRWWRARGRRPCSRARAGPDRADSRTRSVQGAATAAAAARGGGTSGPTSPCRCRPDRVTQSVSWQPDLDGLFGSRLEPGTSTQPVATRVPPKARRRWRWTTVCSPRRSERGCRARATRPGRARTRLARQIEIARTRRGDRWRWGRQSTDRRVWRQRAAVGREERRDHQVPVGRARR